MQNQKPEPEAEICIFMHFSLVLVGCLFGLLKKAFPVKNEGQNVTSKTHTILIHKKRDGDLDLLAECNNFEKLLIACCSCQPDT